MRIDNTQHRHTHTQSYCSGLAPRKTQFHHRNSRRFACFRRQTFFCHISREKYLFRLTPAAPRIEGKCSVRCDKLREMNTNMINQIEFVLHRCSGWLENTSRLRSSCFLLIWNGIVHERTAHENIETFQGFNIFNC